MIGGVAVVAGRGEAVAGCGLALHVGACEVVRRRDGLRGVV